MADKDVRLIIRAKNQASKEIASVNDAMETLAKTTKDASNQSQKSSSVFARLSDEFKRLGAQTKGFDALTKVGQYMQTASAAAARLRSEASSLKGTFEQTAASAKTAGENTARLANDLEQLKGAYRTQVAEADKARAATQRGSEAQKQLTAAQRAYNAAVALSPKNVERDTRITSAGADLASAKSVYEGLQATYDGLKAKAGATRKEIQTLDGAVSESEKSFRKLTDQSVRLETSIAQTETNLAKGEQALQELSQTAQEAAKGLGATIDAEGQLVRTTGAATPQVERLGTALAALAKFSRGNGTYTDPKTASQFQKQRQAVADAEGAWRALESVVKQYASDIAAANGPNDELAAGMRETAAAAKAAKAEFMAQQAVLASLQGTAKTTFAAFASEKMPVANIETYTSATQRLKTAMDALATGTGGFSNTKQAAEMREAAAAADVARQRYELLQAEANRLAQAMRAAGSATAEDIGQFRAVSAAAAAAKSEFREASAALTGMAESGARTTGIFAGLNEGGRTTLSLYQRIRGEVLSLAAAYGGLYGAMAGISGVLDAQQKVEAAQNRLGAVFHQNTEQVGNEMLWLQRIAHTLGIQFGVLSDQYSQFAVAADSAKFSGEGTRDIFLSVAQAGRVNKLSLEQMNKVFLALQQMISKGRIQAEELRQQLGDALPGAVQILSSALGVTTEELGDMMKKGEVLANESNLLKFADALKDRFGSQLDTALKSTTTNLGKFADNIFQAQLQFADGGFIKSFNQALADLNQWFNSRAGRDFFLSLGAAAGRAFDILKLIPENIKAILFVVQALIATKLASYFTGLANNIATAVVQAREAAKANALLAGSNVSLRVSFAALRAGVIAQGAALASNLGQMTLARAGTIGLTAANGVLAGSLGILSAAFRVLWAAVGGWVGVIASAVAFLATELVGSWLGGVNETTQALDEHKKLMQDILTEYDAVKGSAKDWSQILRNMTLDQLTANARKLKTEFENVKKSIANMDGSPLRVLIGGWGAAYDQLVQLRQLLSDGKISAKEFREALEKVYSSQTNDAAKQYIEKLLESARSAEELEKAVDQATDAVDRKTQSVNGLRGTLSDIPSALEKVTQAAKDNKDAIDDAADSTDAYDAALKKLKEGIPSLAAEMKKLKEEAELQATIGTLGFNQITPEIVDAARQRQNAIDVEAIDVSPIKNTISLTDAAFQEYYKTIKGQANLMSKNPGKFGNPNDANWRNQNLTAIETASGQKTQVNKLAAGAFQGLINELESLGYDIKSLGGFNNRLKRGGKGLSEHAFGNAIDINPAANPFGKKFKTDMPANISELAAKYGLSWGGDWKSIKDTMHFEYTGTKAPGAETASKDELEVQKSKTKEIQKQNEEKAKQAEAGQKEIADSTFEVEQQKLKNAGKEREAAIEAAIRDLKAKNPNATKDEIEQVRQLAAQRYDLSKALTVEEQKKKEISDAMNSVNELEEKRNGLLEQRKYYEEQGNAGKVQETTAQLQGVNAQLTAAIDNAIKYQEAMGGTKADVAIQKLQNMKLAIQQTDQEGQKFAMTATQMSDAIYQTLDSGITGLFDTFAQAIANGKNAVGELWTAFRQFAANFLLQIAQMIIKQTLFNALQGISKGVGGGLFSFLSMHTGGVVGSSGVGVGSRSVPPALFNTAQRYHTGGVVGLAPDEVPIVARQGEEVLTEQDARHRDNLAKGGAGGRGKTKIVNLFDAASFLSEALGSAVGEEAILNHVRANPSAWRSALNG